MLECIKYFIDNGKVCPEEMCPEYTGLTETTDTTDRYLENTDENIEIEIAIKLKEWFECGFLVGIEIF
jgi:hypothetical protein